MSTYFTICCDYSTDRQIIYHKILNLRKDPFNINYTISILYYTFYLLRIAIFLYTLKALVLLVIATISGWRKKKRDTWNKERNNHHAQFLGTIFLFQAIHFSWSSERFKKRLRFHRAECWGGGKVTKQKKEWWNRKDVRANGSYA